MPPVTIHPEKIKGPWTDGYVLDRHTISSTPTGDPYHRFDTKRSELGELLYQLKYGGKIDLMTPIVETAQGFIEEKWPDRPSFDCIVPAPPSLGRKVQPVVAMAQELAARLGLPLYESAVVKVKVTPQMKNVDRAERPKVLSEAIQKGQDDVKGRRVLLFDDLIESGATLRRVTEVLLRDGGAASVHVLVLTHTK